MPLFKINSGQSHISIECPAAIVTELLDGVFSSIIQPTEHPAGIHYAIKAQNSHYLLSRNQRATHRNRNLAKILYALEWQIVADWTHQHRHCYILHAAALAFNRQGLVFVGGPGTGKTSYSIFLMRSGLELISDEFACLQLPNYELLPFPRNFVIKPHLVPLLDASALEVSPTCASITSGGIMQKPTIWGKICSEPTPLKKIFLLAPADGLHYHLAPLPQNEAIIPLIQNAFTLRHLKKGLPEILEQIINKATLFRLISPNPLSLAPKVQQKLFRELTR